MKWPNWRIPALSTLLGIGVGAAIVLLLRPAPIPIWATQVDASASEIVVGIQQFTGEQQVVASPLVADESILTWPASGVITENNCIVGAEFQSGQAPFAINDMPILTVHSELPFWRDFTSGIRGDDVAALQQEFNRLTIPEIELTVTGTFNAPTITAARRLWHSVGGNPQQGTLPLSQLIWLPRPEVAAVECFGVLGQQVAAGQPAVRIGGILEALEVPPEILEGDARLVATIPGTTFAVPITADGIITDPDFLSAFSHLPTFEQYLAGSTTTVQLSTRLANPIMVATVPASSLYLVDGQYGCVLDEGVPRLVQILGSQFGQTMVVSNPLPTNVTVAPSNEPSCR